MTQSCRECQYQYFRDAQGPAGDKQSRAMCGRHNVPCDYARMLWFRDRYNTLPSDENCGPAAQFYVARVT